METNEMNDTRQTVLIVDDMPLNIQILARGLASDYNIKIATGGKQALDIVMSDSAPDLVLLDIMMPEIDGYEVCRIMKNDLKTRNIPIIFVTAKAEVEDETLGLSLGAVDYITKPFHMPIVKARVNTQLNLKRKSDLLEAMLMLDALTEIPNRRLFDKTLHTEWNRAKRSGMPLSLIMLDLDYFKSYNDHYGHPMGDACIKHVAQTLQKGVKRSGEVVARYGGEEFAVVAPGVSHQDAITIAEKLRNDIEALKIPHAYSAIADHVTITAGAATTFPQSGADPANLVHAADKMLYLGKNTGRNKSEGTVLEKIA